MAHTTSNDTAHELVGSDLFDGVLTRANVIDLANTIAQILDDKTLILVMPNLPEVIPVRLCMTSHCRPVNVHSYVLSEERLAEYFDFTRAHRNVGHRTNIGECMRGERVTIELSLDGYEPFVQICQPPSCQRIVAGRNGLAFVVGVGRWCTILIS